MGFQWKMAAKEIFYKKLINLWLLLYPMIYDKNLR